MADDISTKYPGIENVVAFLSEAAKTHYREFGEYVPFDNLGIETGDELIRLIEEGNPEAIEVYRKTKETLRL